MAGGGGKDKTLINRDIAAAATPLLARAGEVANTPYTPNRGLQYAAFTPDQNASFQNTNAAANAFGLSAGAGTGLPAPSTSGGFSGYGTGQIYDDNVNASFGSAPQGLLAQLQSLMQDTPRGNNDVAATVNRSSQDRREQRERRKERRNRSSSSSTGERKPPRRDGSTPERTPYDGPSVARSLATGGLLGVVANLIDRAGPRNG